MASLLQKLFQRHFDSYLSSRKVPAFHRRAGYLLSACRTSALGGHVQGCPNGHVQRIQYNACRHRLCDQCAGLARERWLQAERGRLLSCAHRHIIFTIPHQLNALWSHNRAGMAGLVFEAASQTLKTLLGDRRYLGASAGMLLALHTWGRGLWLHPHIHALVSEGGVGADGQWRQARRSHFLPARVVMMVFRGKFLGLLREAMNTPEWVMPASTSVQQGLNLLNKLGRVRWNVRVCERYAHGAGVVNYLARYVRGGPLKSAQVCSVQAQQVVFSYRPHAQADGPSALATMRLSASDFLDRYLTHTPSPGQHMVRRYGLYASACAGSLAQAKAHLGAGEAQAPTGDETSGSANVPLSWQAYLGRFSGQGPRTHCPVCAQPVVFLGRLTPARAPPGSRGC